jgi:hypothetical protein
MGIASGNIHVAHAPNGATFIWCSTARTGFLMGRNFLLRRKKAGSALITRINLNWADYAALIRLTSCVIPLTGYGFSPT